MRASPTINDAIRGTATANGTTGVTVTDSRVRKKSIIVFSLNTVGGTPAGAPYVATLTPGTGFTFKVAGGDTSIYNYEIFNPAGS